MAVQTPRLGIFLEISYPQPSSPPPVWFFSGIYLLLIRTRSQINAALLSTASMGIYIEISTAPLKCRAYQNSYQPLFLRHPPLDPACLLFKFFVFPPLFSVPPCFKVLLTVSPTLTQPPTALIRPTNFPWFKQISKRRFYHFNCLFLSKINF